MAAVNESSATTPRRWAERPVDAPAGRTRVVAYVRVSTEEQAREGVSLAAQRARVASYCAAFDLDLVGVHEDAGLSAKTTTKRPGLRAALGDLEEGRADGLVIVKLDRLTRSVVDLGQLLERYFATRFSLHSIGDSVDTRTAGGRLVAHVLGSVAQWEREAIAERTRAALDLLRSQGVRLGGEALGWRRTGDLDAAGRRVVVEDRQELVTLGRIRELRARGHSLRAICRALAQGGVPTKRGGTWAPQTVSKLLKRAA